MLKRVLPVAGVALVLSVGAALAEPPMAVTEAGIHAVDDHRHGRLTDTEMVSVTGARETCTEDLQALGRFVVVIGLIGLSHHIVTTGQVTIGLAPLACA